MRRCNSRRTWGTLIVGSWRQGDWVTQQSQSILQRLTRLFQQKRNEIKYLQKVQWPENVKVTSILFSEAKASCGLYVVHVFDRVVHDYTSTTRSIVYVALRWYSRKIIIDPSPIRFKLSFHLVSCKLHWKSTSQPQTDHSIRKSTANQTRSAKHGSFQNKMATAKVARS